jgi:hypothetical protein
MPDRTPPVYWSLGGRSGLSPARRAVSAAHLLLGVNAVEMAVRYSTQQLAEATAWEDVSRSADYAGHYPASYPADTRPS